MARWIWIAVALVLAACGGETGTVITQDMQSADAADGGTEVRPDEVRVEPDLVLPELPAGEDTDGEIFTECTPGDGCFGEPCESGADCLSGFCVDHLGNSVCSQTCVEECPAGWDCLPADGGADLVYVCVSRARVLCRPCADNADCTSATGQEDLCVSYGPEGSFCGALCEGHADCPGGYDCLDVSEAQDGSLMQCVNQEGVCPCSEKSIQLALQTPCEVTNDYGTCPGKRICTEGGLSDCDALQPQPEECDGIDNNCDGMVDEGTCDDGNSCTTDTCSGAAGCQYEPLDSGNCDDGDVCTVTDHCVAGSCVGSPISCDDGNPCTTDSCDGVSGCVFENNNEACDDGDPCTIGDLCVGGSCQGTPVECQCQNDADCADLEDDDLCNGTLYCDKSGLQYQCKIDPNSVVECPAPPGQDAPCLLSVCEPATGKCSFVPTNEGGACEDGDSCTFGDACSGGECDSGELLNCNDANPCTTDSCNPAVGCVHAPKSGACNDGNACTYPDGCGNGECVAGPALDCDDSNPCTEDSCNPDSGCQHSPTTGVCNDGNQCTTGDHCQGGFCVSTGSKNCDDGNPCTNDSCLPGQGCLHEYNDAPCSDDDLCTVNDHCEEGICAPGGALDCDDNNPCTTDSCNPLVGCKHTSHAGECDDGDPCTEADTCSGGVCVGAAPLDCDDDNPCTNDVCVPMAGCSHTNNTNPCSDGSQCTVNDHCAQGTCVPGVALNCDDGNSCTDDSCDPVEGCVNAPNQDPCDDGNACTTGDVCANGVCAGAGSLECDDGNPCTKDICLPGGGCSHENIDGVCSDGNPCTVDDLCVEGLCVGGPVKDCNDNNPCTDDACGEGGVCTHTANEAACDDGNPCTVGDHCADTGCVPTGPLACDDGDVCTTDYCHPLQGCVHDHNTAPCNDGNACTLVDTCNAGLCEGTGQLNCNDGNVCTDDACDPVGGCVHVPNAAGCDDGNVCTPTDTCVNGSCVGAGVLDCNDLDVCTDDSCVPGQGCVHDHNTAPCNDSNACTVTDVCADGDCVGSGAPDCNDGNVCTDDSCDPVTGCVHTPNTVGCNDGNACTANDVCANGDCTPGSAINCDDGDPCTDDSCDPVTGCVHENNDQCCVPTGNRAPFNSISQDSASGCWNGNPCQYDSYSWSESHGQNFQGFGQSITCSGSQTCVQHVGLTTYGSTTVCQGWWDVYCDNVKKCTIKTYGQSCTGSAKTNGCNCTFSDATKCSAIKLVAISDGNSTAGCCGGSQPDSMITGVTAW